MKSAKLTCIPAIALFAALAIPTGLAAQEQQQNKHQLRYKLIDLGTFGGPTGYLCNDPSGGRGACGILNNRGVVVIAADTSIPNPNYPNGNPFIPSDPFIFHASQWQGGMLHDLGALPGGYNSVANWISGNGLIAGASENGIIDPLLGVPELNAVLWKDGNVINLGTLDGGTESFAVSVNNHSQVAGLALNTIPDPFFGFQLRPVLWQNGTTQDLGTLGTGTDAFALFVNESGQIAGYSYTNTTVNPVTGFPTQDPFLWQNGTMQDLGTLGGTFGFPNDLNNRGQVVGQSNLAGDLASHPFLWDKRNNPPLTDLGSLGGTYAGAMWINNTGEIVGYSNPPSDMGFHPFLWKNGVMTDLGTIGSDPCSSPLDINSRSQVVGFSGDCVSNGHAWLWESGQIIDLNIFNHPGSGLDKLLLAYNINDSGEIDGLGVPPGVAPKDVFTLGHVFALIPCDDKHGDTEGCEEASSTNEVPQPRPALLEPSGPLPPSTLPQPGSRYRKPASPGFSRNGLANDLLDGIAPPCRGCHQGYCTVDSNNRVTGTCIGNGGQMCVSKSDPAHCPLGKQAISPTNYSCMIKQVTRVDAARQCTD